MNSTSVYAQLAEKICIVYSLRYGSKHCPIWQARRDADVNKIGRGYIVLQQNMQACKHYRAMQRGAGLASG